MAFNQDVPQPNDRIKDSQAAILANFRALKQLIDINHETFGSPNEGKHKRVDMPRVAAPGSADDQVALYAKAGPISGSTEVFMQRDNVATELNWTEASAAQNGYSSLPSGLLMKWGSSTTDGDGNINVDMNATGRAFTTAYIVTITPRATGNFSYSASIAGGTTIAGTINGNNIDFYWFAIGTP